jgi:hypothetical protein
MEIKMNMETFELEELLLLAYGFSEEEADEKIDDGFDLDLFLTDKLQEKDGVLNFVHDLASRLMPFCFMGDSPLTGKHYQGFADIKGPVTRPIAKIEIKP